MTHKLNEHSITSALIKTRYALQYNTSNNSQGLGPGATAHNPPDPHYFLFICLHEQSWVSNVALPSSLWVIHSGVQLARLNCLLWLSIRLFLLPQVLPLIIHSSLFTFLREQYGTGQTSSFLQPYVYFTLADPAMPISPTHVAAGYPPL